MKEKELRRSLAVLPIGTVMKLTSLSARQIRYYEEQGLVIPERNEGNRRMYSLNDIDTLLEIKDYLTEGINMAGIKHIYEEKAKEEAEKKALMEQPLKKISLLSEIVPSNTLTRSKPTWQNLATQKTIFVVLLKKKTFNFCV